MIDIFHTGSKITLENSLMNKEWRVDKQNYFTKSCELNSVVSIKLNIPGAIKNNHYIQMLFLEGYKELVNILMPSVEDIYLYRETGPEAFLVVPKIISETKKITIEFEDNTLLGRLFDIDVMDNHNIQLSRTSLGYKPRGCFICQNNAKRCARSKMHNQSEVEQYINVTFSHYFTLKKQEFASTAVKAMLYEVSLYPKPGLVDPISNGSHPDMTIFTFIDSAESLYPYFEKLFDLAINWSKSLPELFAEARIIGMDYEKVMFKATNGVNTHKGVIFSLGILVLAETYQLRNQMAIQEIIKRMLDNSLVSDFKNVEMNNFQTAGEYQFMKYGIRGARGEAENGFPNVFNVGLPFYYTRNGSFEDNLLDTLMHISTMIIDSNLIKRSGDITILDYLKEKVDNFFALGGASAQKGKTYLKQLDQEFTQRNLSLGGSADLLILVIFLILIKN